MTDLASMTCVPCKGGTPALKGTELAPLRQQLPQWNVVGEHHLVRKFTFPDFVQALAFVNRVGGSGGTAGASSGHSARLG